MIATLCKIADKKNQREDNIYVEETDEYVIGIISDGCSSGKDSAFASQSYVYAFQKVIGLLKKYVEITGLLQSIPETFCSFFMSSLAAIVNTFGLNIRANEGAVEPFDMLATAIFFGYDKATKILTVEAYGDGSIFVNDEIFSVFNDDNAPDYLGYYLTDTKFILDHRYKEKRKKIIVENVHSFSICSDGIDSFRRDNTFIGNQFDPVKELSAPIAGKMSLQKAYNKLKLDNWTNQDDVSIITYDARL